MPTLVRQVYTSPATGIFAPVFRESFGKEVLILYKEQHVVQTCLGNFLLDEAAYAAYLEGKLWINWNTKPLRQLSQQPRNQPPAKPYVSINVSGEAIRLRDAAAKMDVYSFLQETFPGRQIPVPYRGRMKDLPIDEMNLSVRSFNALMRSNARTFGRVKEIMMMEDGLRKIRNLGVKSEKEIIRNFFSACYYQLSPPEQADFWQKVLDSMNP